MYKKKKTKLHTESISVERKYGIGKLVNFHVHWTDLVVLSCL